MPSAAVPMMVPSSRSSEPARELSPVAAHVSVAVALMSAMPAVNTPAAGDVICTVGAAPSTR